MSLIFPFGHASPNPPLSTVHNHRMSVEPFFSLLLLLLTLRSFVSVCVCVCFSRNAVLPEFIEPTLAVFFSRLLLNFWMRKSYLPIGIRPPPLMHARISNSSITLLDSNCTNSIDRIKMMSQRGQEEWGVHVSTCEVDTPGQRTNKAEKYIHRSETLREWNKNLKIVRCWPYVTVCMLKYRRWNQVPTVSGPNACIRLRVRCTFTWLGCMAGQWPAIHINGPKADVTKRPKNRLAVRVRVCTFRFF